MELDNFKKARSTAQSHPTVENVVELAREILRIALDYASQDFTLITEYVAMTPGGSMVYTAAPGHSILVKAIRFTSKNSYVVLMTFLCQTHESELDTSVDKLAQFMRVARKNRIGVVLTPHKARVFRSTTDEKEKENNEDFRVQLEQLGPDMDPEMLCRVPF